jgi:hypothetical protein
MPFDASSLQMMQLVGNVALPAPFPAVGILEIQSPEGTNLMVIRRRTDVTRTVTWVVGAVQAYTYLPAATEGSIDFESGEWVFREFADDADLRAVAAHAGQRIPEGDPPKGIVFVPKDAPVLVRIEFSTTAAESIAPPPELIRPLGCFP